MKGPSLRAQGAVEPGRPGGARRGSIPACAGSSRVRRRRCVPGWVHPRVRGEQWAVPAGTTTARGPSPRARGAVSLTWVFIEGRSRPEQQMKIRTFPPPSEESACILVCEGPLFTPCYEFSFNRVGRTAHPTQAARATAARPHDGTGRAPSVRLRPHTDGPDDDGRIPGDRVPPTQAADQPAPVPTPGLQRRGAGRGGEPDRARTRVSPGRLDPGRLPRTRPDPRGTPITAKRQAPGITRPAERSCGPRRSSPSSPSPGSGSHGRRHTAYRQPPRSCRQRPPPGRE